MRRMPAGRTAIIQPAAAANHLGQHAAAGARGLDGRAHEGFRLPTLLRQGIRGQNGTAFGRGIVEHEHQPVRLRKGEHHVSPDVQAPPVARKRASLIPGSLRCQQPPARVVPALHSDA